VTLKYPALFSAAALLAVLAAGQSFPSEAKTARSAAVVLEFKRHSPCPATGLRRGKCPGYEVDHVTPLCAHGPDQVENLQWLTREDHRAKTRGDVRTCRSLRNAK